MAVVREGHSPLFLRAQRERGWDEIRMAGRISPGEGGKSAPGAFSVRGRYPCSRVLSEGMGRTCSPSARRGQGGSKEALLRACSAGGGLPCPTRFPCRGRRGRCGQYRRKKQTRPFNTRFLMGRGVGGGKMGMPKGVFCQREVPLLPCTVGILLYPSHTGKKGGTGALYLAPCREKRGDETDCAGGERAHLPPFSLSITHGGMLSPQ